MPVIEIIKSLFEGFGVSLEIFALTLLLAIPLGLVISFGSMSKFLPLKYVSKFIVWVIRGTPLMLQLFVFVYAPGFLFNMVWEDRWTPVVLAFVINYAAYFSEIYRAGIEGVPIGQQEAGQVLGLSKTSLPL